MLFIFPNDPEHIFPFYWQNKLCFRVEILGKQGSLEGAIPKYGDFHQKRRGHGGNVMGNHVT